MTTEKLDGFVVALLLLAMRLGEDIHLKAPISEKLYYNLENYYINLLSQTLDELKPIHIIADQFDYGVSYENKNAVCTGFSGGVDSFCSIYDHYNKSNSPKNYDITHLLFNNVGAHDSSDSEERKRLSDSHYSFLKEFPKSIGMEFIKIDSNLDDILQIDFELSHTPRNISCVLLLQKLVSKYYYASAYSYSSYDMQNIKDIGDLDPVAVHLLSTETLDCISVGSQYTRTQKTEIISKYEPTKRYLNVCTDETTHLNCSTCSKCLRTFLTLDILGILDEYKEVMDYQAYLCVRDGYMRKVVLNSRTDIFSKEIVELARSKNYTFPIHVRIIDSFMDILPAKCFTLVVKFYSYLKKVTKIF